MKASELAWDFFVLWVKMSVLYFSSYVNSLYHLTVEWFIS